MTTIILADFSKTFTASDMPTSYSVFAKSGLMGADYTRERNELYEKYIAYEKAGDIEKTQEWFWKHIDLFVKYQLTHELVHDIVTNDEYFAPRVGISELFSYLRTNSIPLRVITPGVANFVETFFETRGYVIPDMRVIGNRYMMDEGGKALVTDRTQGIDTINKSSHGLKLDFYDRVVLLGDKPEDLTIYTGNNRLSIGFGKEQGAYDVFLGPDASLEKVVEYLKK